MSFEPLSVYRCPGDQAGPVHSWASKGVASQEELDAAIADGWHLTLPAAYEAFANPPAAPSEPEPIDETSGPTRAELEQMATELGIRFDGRTADKTLLAKINAALSA